MKKLSDTFKTCASFTYILYDPCQEGSFKVFIKSVYLKIYGYFLVTESQMLC